MVSQSIAGSFRNVTFVQPHLSVALKPHFKRGLSGWEEQLNRDAENIHQQSKSLLRGHFIIGNANT
jgi:hypothetical protein